MRPIFIIMTVSMFFGCATPVTTRPVQSIATAKAPIVAPASLPAPTPAPSLSEQDSVVAALMRAAKTAPALPEQVEVNVGGKHFACYRWPLLEMLNGRINGEVLWSVYVREVDGKARRMEFGDAR